MAAAYASLVSLAHIIEQITHHAPPPIQLHKNMFKILSENIQFLQDFLEEYSHIGCKETEQLENQILDAAYAAEDIIETYIVDRIEDIPTDFIRFCVGIHKVNQDMGLIKEEALKIKENMGIGKTLISKPVSSSSKPLPSVDSTIVGRDAAVIEVMDRLTGYQTNRLILPIVGMGGIGKTTLAKSVYENQYIVQNFDVLAWVTVSQEYNVGEIMLRLLSCQGNSSHGDQQKSEDELGEKLHKSLWGRRYLIVLDDMWSVEAWDKVQFYFPDNNNGSRVLVTTRLRNVAIHFSSEGYKMGFLDEVKSWNLFCREVFGREDCPSFELEKIGRKIANKCKGLPLSIVVVGGLLAKSEKTQEYWEYVVENLNALVNLDDNEGCLKILSLSYHHLPIHLKPCFLHMGVFPEDDEIRVSSLVKLWVAEGFLKPISSKSMEIVAEEYLRDLIDRNLILVHEFGSLKDKVKSCKIHDLLRDVCLREGKKERGLCAKSVDSIENIEGMRRISIQPSTSSNYELVDHSVQSSPLARSLMCCSNVIFPSLPYRLLRVLEKARLKRSCLDDVFHLVNSRYLNYRVDGFIKFPSSIRLLWNLQTLIVRGLFGKTIVAPPEIWEMRQLRHIQVEDGIFLPDPHPSGSNDIVLTNLQTLKNVHSFKCSKEVVKRIPNIEKLKITYDDDFSDCSYSLHNLYLLCKLESLYCHFQQSVVNNLLLNISFAHSLNKLTLWGSCLLWKDMTLIGSLPNLQVLKLKLSAFVGPKWTTSDGQFRRLRRLKIHMCSLESWIADSTHFPCLEKLTLSYLFRLKEIPLDFGEIPTLKSIQLFGCNHSAGLSAKKILEEQENNGNEGVIKVHVY